MTLLTLDGKRVLLTQSNDFMGPALIEVFRNLGAEVIADSRALDRDPELPGAIVRAAGRVRGRWWKRSGNRMIRGSVRAHRRRCRLIWPR